MQFDIAQIPFSRFGSYLSIFQPPKDPGCGRGLYLRTHHAHSVARTDLMRLELLVNNRPVRFTYRATPTMLELVAGRHRLRFCLAGGPDGTVRIEGHGAGLRLRVVPERRNLAQPISERRWSINLRASTCRFMVEAMTGSVRAGCTADRTGHRPVQIDLLPAANGRLSAALDQYQSTWRDRDRPSFAECRREVERAWSDWLSLQPPSPARLRAAFERAAYVNWSAGIRAGGLVQRPAILMSKAWMSNIWSWDHCFNALALCHRAPELALDQWRVMFDRQDRFGALPDSINPAFEHFNFCKPPVHGWALQFMIERQPRFFDRAPVGELYRCLSAWSNWWLTYRRMPGHTLPYYLHGNDSGWDNSTMFDAGAPLAAPDLAALLSIQCAVTGQLADRLGKPRAARCWQRRADELLAALLDELWTGDRFIARRLSDGLAVSCDSLVPLMPVVLGKRLPEPVAAKLVAGLRAHLTPRGLATELLSSREYRADGYWRGPIWAPSTMIAVDGLRALGKTKFATEIARRFCRLCAQHGFAENFDARTGAAQRDPAYTWTSSVFLVLAHEYLR